MIKKYFKKVLSIDLYEAASSKENSWQMESALNYFTNTKE
jgi:hypothetical protein